MEQTEEANISLVIPAYNEEKCLPALLNSVLTAIEENVLSEVIIINDGSTDSTHKIAQKFASGNPSITLIDLTHNSGKGNALAEGVLLAGGEIVLFLDADLSNIHTSDIRRMVEPLTQGEADVSIISIKSNATPSTTLPGISGQRAYFRKDLLPYVKEFRPLGFGIEQFLSKNFSHLKTARISIPTISYMSKYEKRGFLQALFEHANMWPEIFSGSLRKLDGKKIDVARNDQ